MIESLARPVATVPSADWTEPQLLGAWELGSCLGVGAATAVYAARPLGCESDRPWDFAVKVANDESELPRCLIQNEARIARRVRHPHLVTVLESHVDGPRGYLVMPRFEGLSLAKVLRLVGELPPARALWVARQIAEALGALHQAGWRHADVKPDNLVVGPNGHVTLLDLGLAQPLLPAPVETCASWIGTPDYMAPECFATPYLIGSASDIYSLGVMLFEMLAGRRPFLGEDAHALAEAHRYEERPPIRHFCAQVSIRTEWLLMRLLAREPLRRPSLEELVDTLVSLEIEHLGD